MTDAGIDSEMKLRERALETNTIFALFMMVNIDEWNHLDSVFIAFWNYELSLAHNVILTSI